MRFVATGKLLRIRKGGIWGGLTWIDAVMLEGWLGKGHLIKLKLDKKFTEGIRTDTGLGASTLPPKLKYGLFITPDMSEINRKPIKDVTITIIIE